MSDNSLPQPRKRLVYWYTVPVELREASGGVIKLGFVELTANEELFATKRCAGDVARMVFELARESLRFADQRTISTTDETVDELWASFGPSVRNLVLTAYNKLHSTKPEHMADFLDSREVSTV